MSLLQCFSSQIYQSCSCYITGYPTKPLSTARSWYIITCLIISSSKQNEQPSAVLAVLQRGFPFIIALQGCPRGDCSAVNVHFLGCACILCITVCKPFLDLLFLCLLIIGSSQKGHRFHVAGMETMELELTSSYRSLMPEGLLRHD